MAKTNPRKLSPNSITEYKVSLTARTGAKTTGSIYVHVWSSTERLKRAFKCAGFTWGLAVASVFLPGAHFILVPLFLVAGPIVAVIFYRQLALLDHGTGPCPFCAADVVISRGPLEWPAKNWSMDELCTKCQNNCLIKMA